MGSWLDSSRFVRGCRNCFTRLDWQIPRRHSRLPAIHWHAIGIRKADNVSSWNNHQLADPDGGCGCVLADAKGGTGIGPVWTGLVVGPGFDSCHRFLGSAV